MKTQCNCRAEHMPHVIPTENYEPACDRIPLDGICFCSLLGRMENGMTTSDDAARLKRYLQSKNILQH